MPAWGDVGTPEINLEILETSTTRPESDEVVSVWFAGLFLLHGNRTSENDYNGFMSGFGLLLAFYASGFVMICLNPLGDRLAVLYVRVRVVR